MARAKPLAVAMWPGLNPGLNTSTGEPPEQLKGFQRVTLAPHESKTVTFTLGRQNLGFYNDQGQFVVEPGMVDVWVGDSSTAVQESQLKLG